MIDLKNSFTKQDNLEFLNNLLKNYKNKIKCIYIDPPFTTKRTFSNKQGDYAYDDVLDDEEFLKFLEDRIVLSIDLLTEDGFFFIHIDYLLVNKNINHWDNSSIKVKNIKNI